MQTTKKDGRATTVLNLEGVNLEFVEEAGVSEVYDSQLYSQNVEKLGYDIGYYSDSHGTRVAKIVEFSSIEEVKSETQKNLLMGHWHWLTPSSWKTPPWKVHLTRYSISEDWLFRISGRSRGKRTETWKLCCEYCQGEVIGHLKIAISKIVSYKDPPKGAHDLRLCSSDFYAIRQQGLFKCQKCRASEEFKVFGPPR